MLTSDFVELAIPWTTMASSQNWISWKPRKRCTGKYEKTGIEMKLVKSIHFVNSSAQGS